MRTPLLLLPVLFSLSLQAQTAFVPVGAQWTYTQHHFSGPDTNLFVIQCTGDTLIQGRTCSKLAYIEGMNECMPFLPALTRQGDSVLAYQPYYDLFTTLYVFGQAPGFSWETLIEYPFGTDTITWTVTDTGHVDIDWMELRSQQVTATASGYYNTVPLTSGTMIDRLGDLQYLFPWIYGACDSENNFPLRCYEEGMLPAPGPPPSISWLNPQYPQCGLGPDPGAPVVPTGAMWSYNGTHWEDHGVMVEVPHVTQLICTGVDLVHGRLCSVLGDAGGFCNYTPSLLNLRGDTVFYWSELDSAFNTLYVMNTPIGGSWTSTSPFGGDFFDITWTVLDTGSLIVDGVALRQLVVQPDFGSQGTITDRSGSSHYITPWDWGMAGGCDMGYDDGLRCYSDLQISWMDPQYNSCLLLGIEEAATPSLLSIHPNPAGVGEAIMLQFNEPRADLRLEVTDALGRQVYQAAIHDTTTELRIPTAGLYAISVYQAEQRLMTGKVVVY